MELTKCNFCNKELKPIDVNYKKVYNERIPCCSLCCGKYSNKQLERQQLSRLVKQTMTNVTGLDLDNALTGSESSDIK